MFCTNCGKEVRDYDRFCKYCGFPIVDDPPSSSGSKTPPKSTYTPPKSTYTPPKSTYTPPKSTYTPPKTPPKTEPTSPPKTNTQGNSAQNNKGCLSNLITIIVIAAIIFCAVTASKASKNDLTFKEQIQVMRGEIDGDNIPLYHLQKAIDRRQSEVSISLANWDTSICPVDKADWYFRDQLMMTPEYFFIDHRNSSVQLTTVDGVPHCNIKISYFREFDSDGCRRDMEHIADEILVGIPAGSTEWEKALFIHDELAKHITYEYGTYDQTAYSALVYRKAVCLGYALAYEYILERAGIQCDTVPGYGDAENMGMDILGDGIGHAWNIVTFSDGRSAVVDVTWDDPDLIDIYYEGFVAHDWFCITGDRAIRQQRIPMNDYYAWDKWDLDNEDLYYYNKMNYMSYGYDLSGIYGILAYQMDDGKNLLEVGLPDLNTYNYFKSAMEAGDMAYLTSQLGIGRYMYSFTYNNMGAGILSLRIYVEPAVS